jgi:hypothetical protein
MTDRDVIERAATLMDANVQHLKPTGASRLPYFRAVVQGQRAVSLMKLLRPQLGTRRRGQINAVLAFEAARADPNIARREWSARSASRRSRDERGRLI